MERMITAVVLTHNDELIIENTLAHLTWCDELIVVDDYSVDSTPERVKKFNVRFLKHHVAGNFSDQRNFALKEAEGDWVFFVDSDEIVTPELQEEIGRAIDSNSASGYFLKRRDFMFGRELTHGETGNIRLIRLAKKDAGRWTRPVHEVWAVNGTVGTLENPLYHYPHPTIAQFLEEINTYSSLNAQYLYANGVRASRVSVVLYPTAKFFVNYFVRMGFLDGTAGAVVSIMMSFHSFLTRAKLYQLWHTSGTT